MTQDPYTQLEQQLARAAAGLQARDAATRARGGIAGARGSTSQAPGSTAQAPGSTSQAPGSTAQAPGGGARPRGTISRALSRGRWRSRGLGVPAIAVGLALACSAIALAATGLLNGSPVKPEVTPNPHAGNGVPVSGEDAGQIALLASDPAGGLPWGLRVLRTTRGQVCVQVGRVRDGRLGELGLDSAFGDDGRFHQIPPDVLPPGYGGASGQTECANRGQTVIFEDSHADRSGVRLLPGEFEKLRRLTPKGRPSTVPESEYLPPARDLRTLAYGLLGPHAVSITYRTADGLRTAPVRAADGAFLVVEAAGDFGDPSAIGGSQGGEAGPHGVDVILDEGTRETKAPLPIVSGVTFRFGAHLCSQGVGAPVRTRCPKPRPTPRAVQLSWIKPRRSLGEPVGLRLLGQSRAACSAAYLLYPCYRGRISFVAPYAVTAAGTDYNVEAIARCKVGGRPETAWGLERDVRARERVQTVSLGRFVFVPACARTESFRVAYLNPRGPSPAAPHRSVIVGSVSMSHAVLP